MDYLVLARKFRPQTFLDVAGQEHVVRTLANAIGQGRVGHAFLFSGPRGVGKTSIARILAKSLNCETGPTPTPCNVCANCREITDGTSMDVREIDGASNRGIDEIRELRENIKFAPATSRHKIYIIDEVHMLTREAFNALLKTLEEPPGHVIFIFATTENHKVPATILSRCQCYDFRRISLAQIAENLGRVALAEGIEISATALSWIAEAGDGSMRDAQSIFDQVISYAGLTIADSDVEETLGLTDRKYLFSLSDAIIRHDAGACLTLLNEAYLAGIDMHHFYAMMVRHFRNLLLVKITDASDAVFDIPPEQVQQLHGQTETVTRETLQRYLDILLSESDSLRRSAEARIKLETIVVRLAYLEEVLPVGDMLATLASLEQRLQGGGLRTAPQPFVPDDERAASQAPVRLQPPAAVPVPGESKPLSGEDLKRFIKRENPPLGAKLDCADMLDYHDGCLTLGLPSGYIFTDEIKEPSKKAEIERLAGLYYACPVKLTIKTTESAKPSAGVNAAKNGRASQLNEIKREAMNSPILQKVLDEFEGAELIDIKPIGDH